MTSLTLPWKASVSCEKKIQTLDCLRILNILLHDELKTFFDAFSISPETLVLRFPARWQGTSWVKLFDNKLIEDTNFFEICKEKLQHLQNLKLELPIIKKSNESLEKLVLPLFNALPSLKAFEYHPKAADDNNAEENDDFSRMGAFPHDILDFTQFMDCIESKKELEIFEINYQENGFPLLNPSSTIKFHPTRRYELPRSLETVSMCFKFFKDFDSKSFFEMFLANNESRKYVKLSVIYFDCPDAFNGFLKLVDGILTKTEKLELDLGITLYVDNLDKIFGYFTEPIVLNKNIAVKLNIILKPPARNATLQMTDEIKEDFGRIFGNFQYNFIEF